VGAYLIGTCPPHRLQFIVDKTPQAGFNATQHDKSIGKKGMQFRCVEVKELGDGLAEVDFLVD